MKRLILCIVLDLIGLISFTIPGLGESFDVVWAPIAGLVAKFMFGTTIGMLSFLEESLPFTDFFPTFTIAYFYQRYGKNKEDKSAK